MGAGFDVYEPKTFPLGYGLETVPCWHREQVGVAIYRIQLFVRKSSLEDHSVFDSEQARDRFKAFAIRTIAHDPELRIDSLGHNRPGVKQHIDSFVAILR